MGRMLLFLARGTEATEHFAKAVHAEPTHPRYRQEYGRQLAKSGDFAEAVRQLDIAVELQPGILDPAYLAEVRRQADGRATRTAAETKPEWDELLVKFIAKARVRAHEPTPFDKQTLAMDPVDKGVSSTEHTRDVYEQEWERVREEVQPLVAAGEHISHVFRRHRRYPHAQSHRSRSSRQLSDLLLANLPDLKESAKVGRVAVVNGRFTVVPNIDPMMIL